MLKLLQPKFLLLAIFLFIAIEKCENFQLRDLSPSDNSAGSASGKDKESTVAQKFPFRKLPKIDLIKDSDDDSREENDLDSDEDNLENSEDFVFAKVRKPTFEIKKRTNLRQSKVAQFRDSTDDNSDVSDEEEADETETFLSKITNFFKSITQSEEKEQEEISDDSDDDSGLNDDDESTKQPLLVEVFQSLKSLFTKDSEDDGPDNDDDSKDDDESDNDDDSKDDDDEPDNNDEPNNKDKSISTDKSSQSLKNKMKSILSQTPLKLIFDFNAEIDEDDDDDLEESEEDEINYRKLMKEEQNSEDDEEDEIDDDDNNNDDDDDNNNDDDDDDNDDVEQEPEKPTIPEVTVKVEDKVVVKEVKPVVKATPALKKVQKSKENLSIAQKEFEKLLLNLPSFVPDYSKVKNPECHKQGEVFQRQLRGQRIWALQMMDANAKIPSGLLRGNTNQLGDFDLCTKISQKIKLSETNHMKMKGKYCLANIDVVAAVDELKLPVHLIQGRNFLRSTINDPNHFFPRYSTINWGLCLPSACTFKDAEDVLNSFIGPYNSTGIKLHIEVTEDSCYVRQNVNVLALIQNNWKILMTSSIMIMLLGATIAATFNDYWGGRLSTMFTSKISQETTEKQTAEKVQEPEVIAPEQSKFTKILMSFSAKRTIPTLFGFDDKQGDLNCLHGLKAISIMLLFVSLKLIPMGRVPYSNRNKLTEFFNSPLSVFLRSSFLYEDIFLVVSGFLAAFNMLKELDTHGNILWFRRILGKFLRLLPSLLVVLLFYAWIWEYTGNGPQWNAVVTKNADICKENMWKNVFFIQNFFPFEEMCATHTYHLAIDMQLFIIAPLLLWMIVKHPGYGLGIYGALHALSTAARFSSTIDNRLSVVVFHGMKLSQLYRTANLSLAVALHRATPYLVGIGTGVFIKEIGKIQMPKGAVIAGWLSTLAGFIWCFYTPSHLSHKDYQYEPEASAQYAAIAPLFWSLGISWIIFACYTDQSWKLNWILSSKPMIFMSRISYSVFLIMFIVFFYFSGSSRSSEEFHLSSYLDRLEIIILIAAATLFTLIIDLPMQNIKTILLAKSSSSNITEPTVEVVENHEANESTDDDADFESPFADRDDDFVPRRPMNLSWNSSVDNDHNRDLNLNNGKKHDMNGEDDLPEEEITDEEVEEIEEEEEIMKKPDSTAMNARRWKWEVMDD